jgi:hypothetical protein
LKKVPARRYVRSKDTICNYIHTGKKFIYIKNKGKKKKQRDPSKGRTRKLQSPHINNNSIPYFCVFFEFVGVRERCERRGRRGGIWGKNSKLQLRLR